GLTNGVCDRHDGLRTSAYRQESHDGSAASGTRIFGRLCGLSAGKEYSLRRGLGRSTLQLQRKKTCSGSAPAGSFRQGRGAGNGHPENQPGNPRRYGRYNPLPRQFFHESVQKIRLRRLWGVRTASPQFTAKRGSSRLAAFPPNLKHTPTYAKALAVHLAKFNCQNCAVQTSLTVLIELMLYLSKGT